jgi:hypothetical protein
MWTASSRGVFCSLLHAALGELSAIGSKVRPSVPGVGDVAEPFGDAVEVAVVALGLSGWSANVLGRVRRIRKGADVVIGYV